MVVSRIASTPPETTPFFPLPFIDFQKGHPEENSLPSSLVATALKEIAQELSTSGKSTGEKCQSSNGESFLNYGDERGNPGFLRALAKFVGEACAGDETGREEEPEHDQDQKPSAVPPPSPKHNTNGNDCFTEHLFVTSGVSHALELIARTLSLQHPTASKTVAIEVPTYFLAAEIFKSQGFKCTSPPLDPHHGGLNVAMLEGYFLAAESDGNKPLFVYVIPTNSNPTGATYSLERRKKLVEVCTRFGVYIVSDEVYHLLDWSGPKPCRLAALNDRDFPVVFSVGSFTKVFAPGLRVGWIESPLVGRVASLGYIVSQGGVAPFASEVMRRVLSSGGVIQNIGRLAGLYSSRVDTIMAALGEHPGKVSVPYRPAGGYFLWVKFAEGVVDGEAFVDELLAKSNVKLLKGTVCDPTGEGGLEQYARLCFACLSEGEIVEGVGRISKALESV